MDSVFPKAQSYFDKTVTEIYITEEGSNKVKFSQSDSLTGESLSITESDHPEIHKPLKKFETQLFTSLSVPETAIVSFSISPIQAEVQIDYTLPNHTICLFQKNLEEYQLTGTEITFGRFLKNNPNVSAGILSNQNNVDMFIESVGVGPQSMNIEVWPEDAKTIYIDLPRQSTLSNTLEKRISQITQTTGLQSLEHYLYFTGAINSQKQVLTINMDISLSEFTSSPSIPSLPIEDDSSR